MSQNKTIKSSPPTHIDTITSLDTLPQALQTEIEAAAFRQLIKHLQERTDVQNIDLMNLAGFCRNCLSKWYRAAADKHAVVIEDQVAREKVYGMSYSEWKATYQK